MKKLAIIFCVVLILGIASYLIYDSVDTEVTEVTEVTEETTSVGTEPIASFNSVEGFNTALKKNPNQYIGNRVSIRGYMDKLTLGNYIYTWLEDVFSQPDELRDPSVANIKLFITDEVLLTVVEHGDYVEICGTVEIEDGEICLKNCTCTVITAFEESK